MDHEKLGLRVGLEIHRQLDTHKLFCQCPSVLEDEVPHTFFRRLKVTESELGTVDAAARREELAQRDLYYQVPESTCLVELDEEPPHQPNLEALEAVLTVVALLGGKPFDEINFMRKIVIDGSNTTGFQRTALAADGGAIDTAEGKVRIDAVCLEEDAARIIERKQGAVVYRIDRLGIPLIELTTRPDIVTAGQCRRAAKLLGDLLKCTGKMKRGLGTIRQDVNISIKAGTRVEIKGVQNLRTMEATVDAEIRRQLGLTLIRGTLQARNAEAVTERIRDVTHLFRDTDCGIISSALERGHRALAQPLPGFRGLLGSLSDQMELEGEESVRSYLPGYLRDPFDELDRNMRRLGPEFAQQVGRVGIRGVFHSDELPKYGVTEGETNAVAEELGTGEIDAFVIVVEEEEKAREGLQLVIKRAAQAFEGVPPEVRRLTGDGTTEYLRPMPTAARMYPETDVPPIYVSPDYFGELSEDLPELIPDKIRRFEKDYGLSREQAEQLVRSPDASRFDLFASRYDPGAVALIFTNVFAELRNEGAAPEDIAEGVLEDVLKGLAENVFSKEALPRLLSHLAEDPSSEVSDAVEELNIGAAEESMVKGIVEEVVAEKKGLIGERGMGAMGPLMGVIMGRLKGKADGKEVSVLLREELIKYC